jgi:uncharacterized delta-60 repeat protein
MKIVIKKCINIFFLIFLSNSLWGAATISQGNWTSCVPQSNGTLLVAGNALSNNLSQCIVARYTAAGILDTTFNTTGLATTSIGTMANALGLVVQSNGKVVVVGNGFINGTTQIILIRYNTDGSLDSTFGTNGIVTTSLGAGASGNAIVLDAQGNIIIAGSVTGNSVPQFFAARYSATDGTLDTTFNPNGSTPGVATVGIGYRAKVNAIALQPADGKIVLAGWASYGNGDVFAVARFNTDGSLDTTFNPSGAQPGIITNQIGAICHANGVVIQSDESILIVGNADAALFMASFTSAGEMDSSFGTGGLVYTTSIGLKSQGANGVTLDANNNIVITGFADNQLLLARYTSTGALDTTFNSTGYATISYGDMNAGLAVQSLSTGNLVAVGYADLDFLLVEFTDTGSIYQSFGINGVVTQPQVTGVSTTEIYEQQTVGTNGGTFTAGVWQTRTLNTIDDGLGVTLANNQFTLQPGTYSVQVSAPGYQVGGHQIRLQNISTGTTALTGTSAFSSNAGGSQTNSVIIGKIPVGQTSVFEVQHMCTLTQNNDGLGIASGFGQYEVYTAVRIDAALTT